MRQEDEQYFARLEGELERALDIANTARERCEDPTPSVEIPVARDMADRVENILGIDGVAARVRELEGEMSREEAALELVEDFVAGTVGDYQTRAGKIEGAVRTAVALLTEGVVAAPIEGIDRVEVLENDDGTDFVNVYYAGPIRSAGGTAQALSVLVADYARTLLGIDEYKPRDEEVGRYAEELSLYDDEVGLQYAPSEPEARFITRHMPIMLDGESTGDGDVSGYRDLDRVDSNATRGGMCLVLGEGLALKAPKIQRYTRDLEAVDWPWLQDLIDGEYGGDVRTGGDTTQDSETASTATASTTDTDGTDHETAVATADGDNARERSDESPTHGGDAEREIPGGDRTEQKDALEGGDSPDGNTEKSHVGNSAVDGSDTDASGSICRDGPPPRADPSKKFLDDLIAGRPVLSHPSEPGGFRLRYGRARNHGHATAGVHPATMHLVDDFLATGTQIKTERPGKAAGVVPVDSIEGPTVRLANGEVRRIDDPAEALSIRNGVERVLDLGEYLVNYGEFVENNHDLAPASYTVEWWVQEFEAAGGPVQAISDSTETALDDPTPAVALEWATEYDAPLHPAYTYLYHDVSVADIDALAEAIEGGSLVVADGATGDGEAGGPAGTTASRKDGSGDPPVENTDGEAASTGGERASLVVSRTEQVTRTLESLLVEHRQTEDSLVVPDWQALVRTLGFEDSLDRDWSVQTLSEAARACEEGSNAIRAVNEIAPFRVRERAPTRIGNRMGRPEKSEKRELSPAVHSLFPIGSAGGDQRSIEDAAVQGDSVDGTRGQVDVEVARRTCDGCETETYRSRCPDCDEPTTASHVCPDCDREVAPDEAGDTECPTCGTEARPTRYTTVDLKAELDDAKAAVGERAAAYDILKGVKGLTSKEKVPEPLEKGILRAKNDVSVFKDGTVRYDMTDLPVTAVRPAELGVTAEDFRELGYETDTDGDPLRHDDQLVALKVQDIVLSEGAAEHLLDTAAFVDDLLTQYYGLDPYYELEQRDDLVGELVFGMAPHTSAAVVGRIVGFTTAAVGYAHPYFHAAKRRNCFHPETDLLVVDDDGGLKQVGIETLVEGAMTDPTTDDWGTLVDEPDERLRVPSVDAAGRPCVRAIEAVSKHPAPDHLVEINTTGGRTLRVTPDHELLGMARGTVGLRETGELERVAAASLATGEGLLTRSDSAPFGATEEGGGMGTGPVSDRSVAGDGGALCVDEIATLEYVESDISHTYCVTVEQTHTLFANGLLSGQCDGDEDCVMLLLDGLLNFSKQYLPDQRGGRMDAPLVMSSRIDPTEIDDEAHNVDTMAEYPAGFYEATRDLADPADVADVMTIAESTLGTGREYAGFDHTHDTSDIAAGPDLSAYKTLGSMEEKMDAQLDLSRKLRAVDETDVAERIIEFHFLPDLLGNLKAFSSQEFRCPGCSEKYRRAPLSGECRICGGDVHLTVHEGSVTKYMDTAIHVAEEFDARPYTKQRLVVLEKRIERIFEDDTNKQSGIADFM